MSILIVDEEIIDDRIKELCRENNNVRIISIRNLYNFDISDPYKENSSIAERSEIISNTNSLPSFKEEIILNPLTWYKIENTLNEFTKKQIIYQSNLMKKIKMLMLFLIQIVADI